VGSEVKNTTTISARPAQGVNFNKTVGRGGGHVWILAKVGLVKMTSSVLVSQAKGMNFLPGTAHKP